MKSHTGFSLVPA